MIKPGSTIGMLGSGQLGRMFVHAAQQMGYGVHVYSPGTNTPAGHAANLEITAAYDDLDACRTFARQVDVVTLEFENVPVETVEAISDITPVHPGRQVLEVARNRVKEKTTLQNLGLPVPDFAVVHKAEDAVEFVKSRGELGAVLKSAESGYDGKGQARVRSADDAAETLESIGGGPAIIEEFVPYDFELSVISSRSSTGEFRSFDPILNMHENHILDVSVSPSSRVSPQLRAELVEIAESLMASLDVIGVLCVEFFFTKDGRVLINEIAPRPHNSGHLTIEACVTSQFEQQVRAVCGLPLGSTELITGAAMANLLGQHLPDADVQFERLMQCPTAKLHLYGKVQPNVNRKMGHITVTAECADTAEAQVREARASMLAAAATENLPVQES